METLWVPYQDLLDMARRGEIQDGKTLAGDSQGVLPAGGAPNLRQGDSGVMEKKQKVLIVEDEKNIVDILRFNLRKEGYDTLGGLWTASPASACPGGESPT